MEWQLILLDTSLAQKDLTFPPILLETWIWKLPILGYIHLIYNRQGLLHSISPLQYLALPCFLNTWCRTCTWKQWCTLFTISKPLRVRSIVGQHGFISFSLEPITGIAAWPSSNIGHTYLTFMLELYHWALKPEQIPLSSNFKNGMKPTLRPHYRDDIEIENIT